MNAILAKALPSAAKRRSSGFAEWSAGLSLWWSITTRIRLYERLARFVEHNIALDDAIALMLARTSKPRGLFKRREDIRYVYARWLAGMRRGKKFTDPAVAGKDLPENELVMLMMGENTSNPAEGFRQARFIADVVRRMKVAVVSALIYPFVLTLMGTGFLAAIAWKFGPQMLSMTTKPVADWPILAMLLYRLADATKNYGVLVGTLALIAMGCAIWSLSRWYRHLPMVRWFCDHYVPPWSIYREYSASAFLIALGAMVQANMPADEAVARIVTISSPWMRSRLRRILGTLRRGIDAGQAFDVGLLSDDTLGYLEDFNAAGGLDAALSVVGVESVEDSISRIKSSATLISALAMIFVVILIILIYGGMMSLGLMVYQDARAAGGR